tara:strand:- start:158 stop:460 length:303 start_codon:yes stop_codon:yes gene_type:complete
MNIKNSTLTEGVDRDTPMKSWLVDYVGNSFESEVSRAEAETMKTLEWDGTVTVEMIVELMTKEFPDFVMAVAEENFIRGYRQAMDDVQIDIVGQGQREQE